MSNCFGLAFADGKYWFIDDLEQTGDEFGGMDNIIQTLYIECPKQEATMVFIYDAYDVVIHTAQYDFTTDQYYGKGGSKEAMVWIGEESFRRGYETNPNNQGDYVQGRIEYRKPL